MLEVARSVLQRVTVNSPARPRFASVTNESALAPHENAFRRWSMPEIAEGNFLDLRSSAFAERGAETIDANSAMGAARTERGDTMSAHMPPTFTVYTAEQTRNAPMRRGSMPDYDEVANTAKASGVGAHTLLKWTGIGIVAGLAVLTALVVVLNVGDDHARLASTRATIGRVGEPVVMAPPPATTAAITADFEVVEVVAATPPPTKKSTAAKKKKKSTKF